MVAITHTLHGEYNISKQLPLKACRLCCCKYCCLTQSEHIHTDRRQQALFQPTPNFNYVLGNVLAHLVTSLFQPLALGLSAGMFQRALAAAT